MPSHVEENAVALGLAGEAGAGGTERNAFPALPRIDENRAHVLDVAGDHDHLGKKAIRACIGGVADEIDGPAEHALCAKELDELVAQPRRRSRRETIRRVIPLRRVRRRDDGLDIGREQLHFEDQFTISAGEGVI